MSEERDLIKEAVIGLDIKPEDIPQLSDTLSKMLDVLKPSGVAVEDGMVRALWGVVASAYITTEMLFQPKNTVSWTVWAKQVREGAMRALVDDLLEMDREAVLELFKGQVAQYMTEKDAPAWALELEKHWGIVCKR